MKKTLITMTAVLIVGLMAATAFAWGHGKGRHGNCPGQGRGMTANLSEEQQTRLAELRQQFIDQTYETRSAMMTKHQELRMLMETSAPDRDTLKALSEEIMTLKKELADQRIDYTLKAKEIAPGLKFTGFGRHGGCGRFRAGGGFGNCDGTGKGSGPCTNNGQGQATVQ